MFCIGDDQTIPEEVNTERVSQRSEFPQIGTVLLKDLDFFVITGRDVDQPVGTDLGGGRIVQFS